jgi:hypothetical protein
MAVIVPMVMVVVVVVVVVVILCRGRVGMLMNVPVVLVPRLRFLVLRVAAAVLPMPVFRRMVMASMIVFFHLAHLTSLAQGCA